jgi:hypothetical protein
MAFNLSPRGGNFSKTGHGLPGGMIKSMPPFHQAKKVVDTAFRPELKKETSIWDNIVSTVSDAASSVSDYFSGDTQTTTQPAKPVAKPVAKPKKQYKDTVATYAKGSLIAGSNMNYGNGTQMRIPASNAIMENDDVFGGYKRGHQFSEYINSSSDAERAKPLSSFINPAGSKDEKAADNAFIKHYSDPVTLKRMETAGINPKWSYDLIKKALSTPKVNETDKPQNIVPSNAVGVYAAPWINKQSGSTFHPYYNSKNEIDQTRTVAPTGNINYKVDNDPFNPVSTTGTIQHEMAHASFADVLWPSLYKALGKKAPRMDNGQMYTPSDYMNKPTEVYAHFHEFRQNLGIKPGEKMTEKELIRRVEANPSVGGGNFWREFGYDISPDGKPTKLDKEKKAKLVNAINTVASTGGKKENKMKFSGDRNSSYA